MALFEAESKLKELKRKLSEVERRKEELLEREKRVKESVESFERRSGILKNKIEELKKEKEELLSKLTGLKREKEELERLYEEVKEELSKVSSERSVLIEKLSSLREKIRAKEGVLKSLRREVEESERTDEAFRVLLAQGVCGWASAQKTSDFCAEPRRVAAEPCRPSANLNEHTLRLVKVNCLEIMANPQANVLVGYLLFYVFNQNINIFFVENNKNPNAVLHLYKSTSPIGLAVCVCKVDVFKLHMQSLLPILIMILELC